MSGRWHKCDDWIIPNLGHTYCEEVSMVDTHELLRSIGPMRSRAGGGRAATCMNIWKNALLVNLTSGNRRIRPFCR